MTQVQNYSNTKYIMTKICNILDWITINVMMWWWNFFFKIIHVYGLIHCILYLKLVCAIRSSQPYISSCFNLFVDKNMSRDLQGRLNDLDSTGRDHHVEPKLHTEFDPKISCWWCCLRTKLCAFMGSTRFYKHFMNSKLIAIYGEEI